MLRINHKRHNNEKRLNFQVNLFLGRKRNTLFGTRCSEHVVRDTLSWGSNRNVAPSTTLGTTKHTNNEKRLTFSSKPFLLGESGTRCHGARIETSHRPRPSVPQNTLITKKGLLFQVNLFFWEKDGARTHDPRYHKPML